MSSTDGSYVVHTEARGPHWIAWLTLGADPKPERSVILIAATENEAKARIHEWVEARKTWGLGAGG